MVGKRKKGVTVVSLSMEKGHWLIRFLGFGCVRVCFVFVLLDFFFLDLK